MSKKKSQIIILIIFKTLLESSWGPEYTPSLFIFGKSGIMRQATVFSYEQDIQVTERNFLS